MTLYDDHGREVPALAPNAAEEAGGNLEKLATDTRFTQLDLLRLILIEARVQTQLLATLCGVSDTDLAAMRQDPQFTDVR